MSANEAYDIFEKIRDNSTGYLINLKKSQDLLTNSKPATDYNNMSFLDLVFSVGPEDEYIYDPEIFWNSFSLYDFKRESTIKEIHSATKELVSLILSEKENRKEVAECAANLAIFLRNDPSAEEEDLANFHKNSDSEVKFIAELANPNPSKIEKIMELPIFNEANKYNGSDKWKIDFFESVDEHPRLTPFWGPAVACLIMRLEKQTPNWVAKKIVTLQKSFLFSSYLGEIQLPDIVKLEKLLTKYRGLYLEPGLKNSVFIRFVLAYRSNTKITTNGKGLLDFVVMQSMKCKGLCLFPLVSKVLKEFGPLKKLVQNTLVPKSVMSWSAVLKMLINIQKWKHSDMANLWMFAREFSNEVFSSLSYNRNSWLCNFLASVLDLGTSMKPYTYPYYGPTYRRIHAHRRNCCMSELDYEVAVRFYKINNKPGPAIFFCVREEAKNYLRKEKDKEKVRLQGLNENIKIPSRKLLRYLEVE